MNPRARGRLLFAAWLAWTAFLLSHYYVQILRAVAAARLPGRGDVISAAVAVLLVAGSALLIHVVSVSRPYVDRRFGPRPPFRHSAVVFALAGLLTVPWALTWPQLAARISPLVVPGFPSLGEAAARLLGATIGAALVAAAALGAGGIVLRLTGWRSTSRIEHVVFAAVTGAGVVSYGSLLLAVAGLYRPTGVAALIAVLLLASAALAPRIPHRETRPRDAAGVSPVTALCLGLVAAALCYALVAALAPEKEYDALWYHLQLPRLWLEAGRPVDVVEEYVSLYPLTWELVFAAGMSLGGPVAAKLLHFSCLPLLALLVGRGARRFMPGVSPAAAAAFLVTTPTLLWESTTAYVDLALALHTAAACYALARYAERRERPWGIVAALQFGLAASTKHLGVFVTLIALGVFVLADRRRRDVQPAIGPAVLIGLLAATLPAPWYLRAWLRSGNPVFPEMFALFGASPPERWNAISEQGLAHFKAHFGMGRSPLALLALPWNVTVHGALFGGSLGPLFLVLLPILLFARRQEAAVRWLTWGILAYVALWASPVSSFQLRFLMPIVPAMALLAAAALDRASRWRSNVFPHVTAFVPAGVMCLALLNLPPFTPLHEADRDGWEGWLTHVLRRSPNAVVAGRESQAVYLQREVPSFGAWQWINRTLPPGARVLALSGGDQLYAARPRISHDATMARTAVWGVPGQRVDATRAELRRLRITHILFDRRELSRVKADAPAIAAPELQQACVREYDDGRYWVCRLD